MKKKIRYFRNFLKNFRYFFSKGYGQNRKCVINYICLLARKKVNKDNIAKKRKNMEPLPIYKCGSQRGE